MTCNKCKQAPPQSGDSWCLACAGWEAIGVELGARWNNPALRALAEEAVVGAVRQVRGLRKIACLVGATAGSGRAGGSGGPVAATASAKVRSDRPPLPRLPPPPAPKEELPESDEAEGEGEESEETEQSRRSEPRRSPTRRESRGGGRPVTPPRERPEASRKRERSQRRDGDRGSHRHKSRRRHRGGRKHKRLARGLTDPSVPLHRSTPGSYWDLTPNRQGLGALPTHP